MATAIAFRSVSKRFPNGTQALSDASWTLEAGDHVCLVGPSGSGKSTSVHLLEGVLQPDEGSVLVLGAPVGSPDFPEARRRMGVVPQGAGMYPDLTAGEYLNLAGRLYGVRAHAAIEALGLGEHLHARLSLLAPGLQRRVSLAAAVVGDPDILVLDEPTFSLDPVAAQELRVYLRDLMRGRTAVICTHNVTEAEALAQHLVLMRQGRVVAQGTLAELRRRTRARLRLAAREGPEELLAALDKLGRHADEEDGAVLASVDDPEAEAPRILRELLEAGLQVYECAPVRASLEQLYPEELAVPEEEG
jgi:ABC-type multidrug transport system ATPase subunit